jgi:hypothetical protein
MAQNPNTKALGLIGRLIAPTPKFHKVKRNLALVVGAIAGIVAAQTQDPMIAEIAKAVVAIAGGVAVDSQTTVE